MAAPPRLSRKQAAQKVKVSETSIRYGKKILAAGNAELLAALEADQIGLEKAAEIAGMETKNGPQKAAGAF
jgi:hypothetical protein